MVARSGAQNAAHAGALAGATALAFDKLRIRLIPFGTGPAKVAAQRLALSNGVISVRCSMFSNRHGRDVRASP